MNAMGIDSASSSVIEQQLSSGERLIWSGQPRGGIRLRASDAFVIPFSILWCGFAIVWEAMALMARAKRDGPTAVVFPLFGVPFVIIGLYFVFGRFIVDARLRRATSYGLTNERVIIVSGLFGRRTKSLVLRTLSDISLTEPSRR
jgi:Bacterial PH domain